MTQTRTIFAFLPIQLWTLQGDHKVRTRTVWLRKVTQRLTFWDGWEAFDEDNK